MDIDVDKLFWWLFWAGLAWGLQRFVPTSHLLEALWSRRRESFAMGYSVATAFAPSGEKAKAIVLLYVLAIMHCFYDLQQSNYRTELRIRRENYLERIRPRWQQNQIRLGLSMIASIVLASLVTVSLCIMLTQGFDTSWNTIVFVCTLCLLCAELIAVFTHASDDFALARMVVK